MACANGCVLSDKKGTQKEWALILLLWTAVELFIFPSGPRRKSRRREFVFNHSWLHLKEFRRDSQWFQTSLRIKSKIFSMACNVHPGQACAYLSSLISHHTPHASLYFGQCDLLIAFLMFMDFLIWVIVSAWKFSLSIFGWLIPPTHYSYFNLNATSSRNL